VAVPRSSEPATALRYIFEVLAAAAEKHFVGNCKIHRGFSLLTSTTELGTHRVLVEASEFPICVG